MAGTIEQQGGTAASVLAYTGAARQFVIDTDHWQGRIMDGSTAGGILIGGARRDTQTGTTYTVLTADQGKIITFSNASAVAVTLPQAGSSAGAFMPNQTGFLVLNLGAGAVTITPTTSTINGLATLVLNQYDGARIISDGTNYLAVIGRNATSGGGGGTPGGSTYAVQYAATASTFGGIGPLAAGQIVIGTSATSAPGVGTIAAGTNVSIGYSGGTITINATAAAGGSTGLFGPVMSSVLTSAGTGLTTWISQGTSTISDGVTGISLKPQNSNTDNCRLRGKVAPGSPYKIAALLLPTLNTFTLAQILFGFADGLGATPKIQAIGKTWDNTGALQVNVTAFSNPSTFNSNQGTAPSLTNVGVGVIWLVIEDDGTNAKFGYNTDGGDDYVVIYTVAKASGYLGSGGYSNIVWGTNLHDTGTTGQVILAGFKQF